MSEVQQPSWLEGWKPAPPPKDDSEKKGPWKPGQSGNPAGRPPGRPDKRLLATQQMLDEMRDIVAVLVGKALEGDVGAAALVMARVLPSLRAQSEKVAFPFDASAPVSRQVEMVLEAVSSGHVAADVGKQIIEAIQSLSTIRATEDLEARIITLEQRQV